MKKTFVILLASTALIAGIGLPRGAGGPLPLVRDTDGEGRDQESRLRRGDDNDPEGDEEDDDDSDGGNASGAAPAGSVAPPNNGLFGTGVTPKVQVN